MAEAIICPQCNKTSYTAAPYESTPCPYCGFVFREINRKGTKDDEESEQRDRGKVKR